MFGEHDVKPALSGDERWYARRNDGCLFLPQQLTFLSRTSGQGVALQIQAAGSIGFLPLWAYILPSLEGLFLPLPQTTSQIAVQPKQYTIMGLAHRPRGYEIADHTTSSRRERVYLSADSDKSRRSASKRCN